MSDSAARDEYDALFDLDKRGSKHPEDQDDKFSASLARSDDEDTKYGKGNLREKKKTPESEDEDDAPSSSKMRSRYFLPRGSHLSSNANTGPKGVIADAYAFETAKETAKKSRRLSFLPGKRVSSFKPTPPPAQYRREPEKSEGSEEEDDDFMQEWRQARLRELQQAAIPGQEARRHSPSGRRWGTVQTVDGEAFLDAVEKSPKDAVVVTLIYDDAVRLLLSATLWTG